MISIHTLTQRVTWKGKQFPHCVQISIHTLTQRVTPTIGLLSAGSLYFNPHPHAEGDNTSDGMLLRIYDFNPHPHAEGDVPHCSVQWGFIEFQSTPSRRGWRVNWCRRSFCHQHFNPHPHAEGDAMRLTWFTPFMWFQSTPSRRGWHVHFNIIFKFHTISIHTLTQRVTSTYL